MEILSAQNVTFSYPDATESVLDDIHFTIQEGDFVLLCGPSGSGKSTLLRLLKEEIAPHGNLGGNIYYRGSMIKEQDRFLLAKEIGMVFQDPENQIVMERVMDELLFGMENMGYTTDKMRKKVAEMVHFFGLNDLVNKKTAELSGGQKQLINLASVLLLEPKLLLLDEPTAQLDPIAAKEFIHLLERLNDEFGITILVVEHRMEELFSVANRVMLLDKGHLVVDQSPRKAAHQMYPEFQSFLPSTALCYMGISQQATKPDQIPLTVKEAKQWISTQELKQPTQGHGTIVEKSPLIELKAIDFQYTKHSTPVLYNLSFSINKGEWMALVGANGTGKTTLLKLIGGLIKPQHGTMKYNGKKVKNIDPQQIGYLPQNPRIFFLHDTLKEEYQEIARKHQKREEEVQSLLEIFQLADLLDRHPYDLSGGELQKAALVGILLGNPSILLIDEPTKGMDPSFKKEFGLLVQGLVEEGLTVIMVTHDIEFAASYATRCSMLFQGDITVTEPTKQFFQENTYYTTMMNRITRDFHTPALVTLEEAMLLSPNHIGS
ncbi:energy-coupling factor transport system ATP-binding protein [Oceanobacillus limi]|uniref:Energy-coupling factor transport system ATP-binding protein n=1 Tax=Oceanobacillus limi TaxID=930131 RepID=A0A1H9YCJ2_9BACI|nr:ABC transporter ATP-binding protein [Oceanobacillus limi]SES66254.1 energy-coupling factor transport system ATP-binding protein [Oceanobacillus limi]